MRNSIAATTIVTIAMFAGSAQSAGININFEEIGDDVVISFAGALDTTGLSQNNGIFAGVVQGGNGFFSSPGVNENFFYTFYRSTGESPLSFGTSFTATTPDEYAGTQFSFSALDGLVGVRQGYVSNEAIDGSATIFDTTLTALSIDTSEQTFSFGMNTITYNGPDVVGSVPVPAALPLLIGSLGALFMFRRRT